MLMRTLLDPPRHHPDSCAAGVDGVVGCRMCVDTCPYSALRPRTSAGRTVIEVDASSCERCGACTAVCPTSSLERAFLPADELRSLALAAIDGGRPLALVGDHHLDVVAGLTDAGWGVVELPSVLIVDTTLLVAAHLAGAPAVAVLGCPACHHDTLGVVAEAASNAAAITDRHGATLVADISTVDLRSALAELLAASQGPIPIPSQILPIDGAGQRQQLVALLDGRVIDDGSTELVGFGHVDVDADACTLCGACSRTCPTGALQLSDGRLSARDIDCIGCTMCVSACPESAVGLSGTVAAQLLERRELVADVVVPCAGCGEPHLPARLLERARETVTASGRPPTVASRQIELCPSCRTLGPDGFRGIDDGRPVPVGVPQLDRRSFLAGSTAAAVGGMIGMVALGDSGSVAAAPRPDHDVAPGRLGMVIDIGRCIGCHACTAVCKAENHVPLDVNRDWVEEYVQGEYPHATPIFVPKLCNHCDDPGCLRACPTGAIFKRADGIVDLDHTMCIGCRACNQACPYGATFVDPVRHTADKCNLCSHRVDEGLRPACVDVCPSQCRIFGDLDDPDSAPRQVMAEHATTVLRPELGLGPNVHYVGLPSDPGKPTTATTVGHGRA